MNYDVSIIIPFLNEAENILTLATRLDEYVATLKGINIEVLFVDDGSIDNSLEILAQYSFKNCDANIIKLSKNYGSHSALRAGVLHSKGEFVTFVYADLQDPLRLISELYNKCKEGFDIVWAERNSVTSGFIEKCFSRIYAKLMRKFAASNFPEKGFDIVMFNKKIGNELNQNIESNSSVFLQILTMGFRQSAITYNKECRKAGQSKWTFSKKVKIFIDSFVAFSYAPVRLVSIVGILLFLLGTVWAFYISFRTFVYRDLNQGWPSLVSILMIGFGVTNVSLGIISEYLWRTLDASRKRKVFIVDQIIERKRGIK